MCVLPYLNWRTLLGFIEILLLPLENLGYLAQASPLTYALECLPWNFLPSFSIVWDQTDWKSCKGSVPGAWTKPSLDHHLYPLGSPNSLFQATTHGTKVHQRPGNGHIQERQPKEWITPTELLISFLRLMRIQRDCNMVILDDCCSHWPQKSSGIWDTNGTWLIFPSVDPYLGFHLSMFPPSPW